MNSENNNSNKQDAALDKLQNRHGMTNNARGIPSARMAGNFKNNAGNNLANKIATHRVKKAVDPEDHERPNLGVPTNGNGKNEDVPSKKKPISKNDIASRNLRNSLANRVGNILKNRQKKKEKDNNPSENSSDSSSDNNDNKEFGLDDLWNKGKVKLKIKIAIYASIGLLILIIFGTIIMAIFGVNISSTIPAINQSNYGTDKFLSTYDEGTDDYKKEIKYYEKLRKTSEDYLEENGEDLKTNYIHSVLIYKYYLVDDINVVDDTATFAVDYSKMTEMIDEIVDLMKPSDEKKNIDYEKKGEFYNNLKNSSEFKKYYKDILAEKSIDELLDEMFDFANELEDVEDYDDTVITEETKVVVNKTNNTSSASNTSNKNKPSTISMNEYIAGSIYANDSINNQEKVKAYTIAYSTNIVAKNKKLTVTSSTALADNLVCSVKLGCSYDSNGNLVDGKGERSSQNTVYYNGGYYYKPPLSSSEIDSLNKSINSVYGNVLVNTDGTYPEININTINGLGSGSYKDILESGYGSYKLKNIGEDSYILDGSYGSQRVLTNVIFYDQNDYKTTKFCGLRKETIKTSGCGTTAMSMVVSTYENDRKYDPVMMMNTAHKTGYCGSGISGTSPGFFKKEANTMKYKYLRASKNKKSDLNLVLKHLAKGHLVITHMKSGHFTGGGHYMVLGGVDPATKKVYVYDPNNASNSKYRKSGNGWYSFNDIIVKESFNYFYIIWKG